MCIFILFWPYYSGGVYWDLHNSYKNAITNELFLVLATDLYEITNESQYLDWAEREVDWFLHSGMINSRYLVNDGLNDDCYNNQQTTWTYNQGQHQGYICGVLMQKCKNKKPPKFALHQTPKYRIRTFIPIFLRNLLRNFHRFDPFIFRELKSRIKYEPILSLSRCNFGRSGEYGPVETGELKRVSQPGTSYRPSHNGESGY